jgi:hypothetical protein
MENMMAEYALDEKQKHLLQALVPGLKQARIGLEWTVILGAHINAIFETGHINLRSLGWHRAERKDFDQFVAQGFFTVTKRNRVGEPSVYTLNDDLIIRAVESGFQQPDAMTP